MTQEKHIHFDEAKEFILKQRCCFTSDIQKHFKISYDSASELLDELRIAGIIKLGISYKPFILK